MKNLGRWLQIIVMISFTGCGIDLNSMTSTEELAAVGASGDLSIQDIAPIPTPSLPPPPPIPSPTPVPTPTITPTPVSTPTPTSTPTISLYVCGDANGDEKVDVADLGALNACIFSANCIPTCDATGDRKCDVQDISAVNAEIFSPGVTATCDPEAKSCTLPDGSPGFEVWQQSKFVCL